MYKKSQLDDTYLNFSNMLTGYRMTQLMLTVADSGMISFIDGEGTDLDSLCQKLEWVPQTGFRFIQCLCDLGFLERRDDKVLTTPFSARFLHLDSPDFQGSTLSFEKKLFNNWQTLAQTVADGHRPPPQIKSDAEYASALSLFLGAMDEAARIRAAELWNTVELPQSGTILEIGAGSGAYLAEFLRKNPLWQAVFCDLEDVVTVARTSECLAPFADRITYLSCNFLDDSEAARLKGLNADVLLLSNVVHCQGPDETATLFANSIPALNASGKVIVHDFFRQANKSGSLYDLHMMVNTYNGRTYSCEEIEEYFTRNNLKTGDFSLLPSGSAFMEGFKV